MPARSRELQIEEDARMYHCSMLTNARLPLVMITGAPLSETRMQNGSTITLPDIHFRRSSASFTHAQCLVTEVSACLRVGSLMVFGSSFACRLFQVCWRIRSSIFSSWKPGRTFPHVCIEEDHGAQSSLSATCRAPPCYLVGLGS